MKKSLLIAIAAFFVALGANAQSKQCTTLDVTKKMSLQTRIKSAKSTENADKISKVIKRMQKVKGNRRSASDIEGAYIMDGYDPYGEFATPNIFNIEAASGSITLDLYDEPQTFEYNVKLTDFGCKGGVIYGYYVEDESGDYIAVPVQVAAESTKALGYSKEYGRVAISGGTSYDPNVGFSYGVPFYLDVTEDGLEFSGETSDGDAITSWIAFLPDYTGDGNLWDYGFDAEIFLPTAVSSCRSSISYFCTDGTTSGWGEAVYPIAIEDFGESLVVHNFMGECKIDIRKNEDGSWGIPAGQRGFDSNNDQDEPYGYYRWVGMYVDNEGYLRTDWEKDVLTGFDFAEDGMTGIEFYKTEHKAAWDDEDGHHEEGDYFLDEPFWYFNLRSGPDAEGLSYWLGGYLAALYFVNLADGGETGIKNVNGNVNENTTKTFNMLGQEVGKDAKGLLIRDGKKFVVK